MKITIAILVTSICVLVAQDAPITPEQRFNLPPAGRTIDGKPFDYNSMSDTNTSAETRRKVRGEPSARERRMEERRQARATPRVAETKSQLTRLSRDLSGATDPAVALTLKTNVSTHWLTIEEQSDVLKQVGTIITNRVAILTHDAGTNEVTLKMLGRGPAQVRTVRRAQ